MYRASILAFASLFLSAALVTDVAAEPPVDLEAVVVKIMQKAFQVGDYDTVETLFDKLSIESKKKFLQHATDVASTMKDATTGSDVNKCTFADIMFMTLACAVGPPMTDSKYCKPYEEPGELLVILATMFEVYRQEKTAQTQLLGRMALSLYEHKTEHHLPIAAPLPHKVVQKKEPSYTTFEWMLNSITGESPQYGSKAWLFETKRKAEQDDADAQYSLGMYYSSDRGNWTPNLEVSTQWLRKAAEQGHFKAQYTLSVHFQHGIGVPKDDAEAAKWHRKVAEREHVTEHEADYRSVAQHMLGNDYYYGRGVPVDKAEAAKWIRLSIESKHHQADEWRQSWESRLAETDNGANLL